MCDGAITAQSSTTAVWWVQVRGQAYGPYTMGQLRGFVTEGRVRPATQVSDDRASGWTEARRVPGLITPLAAPREANDSDVQAANVFVFAEIITGAWPRFMAAMEGMGTICDLAPGLWLVRTPHSAGVVRNNLSQTLDRGDRFVVIDATRDRMAWFNLGPEVDVKITHVWNGPVRVEKG